MRFAEIEDFEHLLGMLSVIQIMRDSGDEKPLLDEYKDFDIELDLEWTLFFDALEQSAECYRCHYLEGDDCDEHFFSDRVMTEYYRLCKEYGRRNDFKFAENPYVAKADKYVHQCMEIDDYGYGWKLSTGTQHKHASALHVFLYPDFCQTVWLLQSVRKALRFYHDEIESLRRALDDGEKQKSTRKKAVKTTKRELKAA